ncbi:MAG: RNA methyltransferase [Maribacter sp.]
MVVKSELKLIKSLHQKKYRSQHGLFIIEGLKAVQEVLDSDFEVYRVYATVPVASLSSHEDFVLISQRELQQISGLKNPNGVLGVFNIPVPEKVRVTDWILVLDGLQDPGNMGTIIRLCDWFGIRDLVCSEQTVDCFNPKVLQATMGSITRINIIYKNLEEFLKSVPLPILGSTMDGESMKEQTLPEKGILVMGNEGKGISPKVAALCNRTIAIPQYGQVTTESLNVATASAILLNEIRRF